jgi:hypothetical protein
MPTVISYRTGTIGTVLTVTALLFPLLPAASAAGAAPATATVAADTQRSTAPRVTNYTESGVFVARSSGDYRVELLGAGGAGGAQSSGWDAGGGGGGGGYASGVVSLDAGDRLRITVGSGGRGLVTRAYGPYRDGPDGGDTSVSLDGEMILLAGGGEGGRGVNSSNGGRGGSWVVDPWVVSDRFGFDGGSGGPSVIKASFRSGYHQGGEGGSAANSSGPGNDGTTRRCVWTAAAVPGNLPAGAGAFGYYGGYDDPGSCGTDMPADYESYYWPTEGLLDGERFGGGGGGMHNGYNEDRYTGSGAGGYVRVTRLGVGAPDGVEAVVDGNAVVMSWSDVGGADSYRVVVTPGGEECWTSGTSCEFTGLVWGGSYQAVVYAVDVDAGVESGPSDAVFFAVEERAEVPSGGRVSPSGSIAVVTWDAVDAASYRVLVTPGDTGCSTVALSCTVSGLTRGQRYAVRVVAVSGSVESDPSAPVSFVAGDAPGPVSGVGVVAGAGAAVVSWSSPADAGDSSVTGYRVVSSPGGVECVAAADESSCEVAGLSTGVPYLFTVYAVSDVGQSPGVVSGSARVFTWPSTPGNVREGITTSGSAQVRWDASTSPSSAVSGYVVRFSRDGGATWVERAVPVSPLQYFIPELAGAARAAWVQVAAVNASGRGAWSEEVLVTSKGARPMRVEVVDHAGVPVIGGAITWWMRDVNVKSSLVYGLTDDGAIDFPMAPAGWVQVRVTGAVTESGLTVSGTFTEVLGFSENVLVLPEAPVGERVMQVVIPGAAEPLPVPGVQVSLDTAAAQYDDADCIEWAYGTLAEDDWCLDYADPSVPGGVQYAITVEDFTFEVQPTPAEQVTDAAGRVRIRGFMEGQPLITVTYDDGIITQGKDVVLRGSQSTVELDYMPWIEVDAETLNAGSGSAVTIPVTVETSSGVDGMARSGAGVRVTVVPPRGAARGTCSDRLTATTNSQGVARVTVCATKSGVYRFRTQGAAATDGVLIRVRGAAPMAPTSVTVRSLSVGTARATWAAPVYDGGSPVTGYVITATAPGKATVTRTVPATTRNITLRRLANATTYTVRIQARTARGLSDPTTTTTPIA